MTSGVGTPRGARLGLIQVCTAAVLWGTAGVVVTEINQHEGQTAMTLSAWRMSIAALALICFAAATGRLWTTWRTVRSDPVVVVLVGVGTAGYQGLYFASVLLVGVTVATVVSLGLAPLLASIWEHAHGRSRPSGNQLAVVTAALAGLVLISVASGHGSEPSGNSPTLGLVLAIGAGATYAATTVLGHELAQRIEPVLLTTAATSVGAVVLVPFFAIAALRDTPVVPASGGGLGLLIYLGVVTMALSYVLLYAGLRTTVGSAATIATLLEPLSAVLLAVLLLGERLPLVAVIGGGMILMSVTALGRDDTGRPPQRLR